MRCVGLLSITAAVLVACGGHAPPPPPPAPVLPAIATDSEIRVAGAVITPMKVLDRIGVIADDSMGGRNTPSAGLETTAQYLAANYQRWGLRPMGDSGTYFQRYPIARVRSTATSYLEITDPSGTSRFSFDTWATVSGPMTGQPITGPIKVISGALTTADIDSMSLQGYLVVFAQNPARPTENGQVLRALGQKNPAAVLVLRNTDPVTFRAGVATAMREGNVRAVVLGMPPTGPLAIIAHDSLFAGMQNAPDFAAMHRATDRKSVV